MRDRRTGAIASGLDADFNAAGNVVGLTLASTSIGGSMREYGSVSIPQEAFIAALRMGEE